VKNILIILVIIFYGCSSGRKYCDPASIRSGKSSQHHDGKKFRGMIRVKWMHQIGNYCLVKFENMKQSFSKVYNGPDCAKFKVGCWVSIDSI
jgi:hypothetical protein